MVLKNIKLRKQCDKYCMKNIAENLMAYKELLTEHIRKEDEILYPWMDNQLSTRQVGELFTKFAEADQLMGFSPDKYEHFIDQLEIKYRKRRIENGRI